MLEFASNYYLIFGLLILLGGFIGYFRKRSRVSLLAGLICGGGLTYCSSWLEREPLKAILTALAISFIVFFRFFMVWLRRHKVFPHVPIILLSLAGIIIGILVVVQIN